MSDTVAHSFLAIKVPFERNIAPKKLTHTKCSAIAKQCPNEKKPPMLPAVHAYVVLNLITAVHGAKGTPNSSSLANAAEKSFEKASASPA